MARLQVQQASIRDDDWLTLRTIGQYGLFEIERLQVALVDRSCCCNKVSQVPLDMNTESGRREQLKRRIVYSVKINDCNLCSMFKSKNATGPFSVKQSEVKRQRICKQLIARPIWTLNGSTRSTLNWSVSGSLLYLTT